MNRLTPRRTFIAGALLVLLTNAVVLAGIAWNRHGEPESLLTLSERELLPPYWPYPHARAEDSGLALALQWRVGHPAHTPSAHDDHMPSGSDTQHWLDAAKMQALGFHVPSPDALRAGNMRHALQAPREVLLVLELDGAAYRASLAAAQEVLTRAERLRAAAPDDEQLIATANAAREQLAQELTRNSRLFVIDAGPSVTELRARYPDRQRHAIVAGTIAPDIQAPDGTPVLRGVVTEVLTTRVQVPAALRATLLPLLPAADGQHGHFRAELAFGRRLEPWLVSLAATDAPAATP